MTAYDALAHALRLVAAALDDADNAPTVGACRSRSGQTLSTVSVLDAVNDFLVSKARSGRSDRYLGQIRSSLGHFCASFGRQAVDTITPQDVERWLTRPEWSPRTRRNYLVDVATLCNWLVRRGALARSPCAGVEKPVIEAAAPGIHTPDQVRQVLTAAATDADVRRVLALQYFAGIRPEEAQRLEESNFLPGYVEVGAQQSKTRRRRLVKIGPTLRAWLAVGGRLPVTNFRKRWQAVRRLAGVPWSHDVTRHTFASYHLALTGSADATAHELGHESAAMLFRHYRAVVTREAAQAFFGLRP